MMVTTFQKQVYDLISTVPTGGVTTYGDVAKKLKIKSPRAVGQALKCNPFAPKVPCHRVVKSDGSLGGFNGSLARRETSRKIDLLEEEGVFVRKNVVVNFSQFRHRL